LRPVYFAMTDFASSGFALWASMPLTRASANARAVFSFSGFLSQPSLTKYEAMRRRGAISPSG